jgi:hypothetical protein
MKTKAWLVGPFFRHRRRPRRNSRMQQIVETWSDECTMGISLWRRVTAVIVKDDFDVPLFFGVEIHRDAGRRLGLVFRFANAYLKVNV